MRNSYQTAGAISEVQLHDLRNRLTVVKGVAQLLDRQVRRDDWEHQKIIDRVGQLQDEIDRLEQLVDGYESHDGAGKPDGRHDIVH